VSEEQRQRLICLVFAGLTMVVGGCSIDSSGIGDGMFQCNTTEPCPVGFNCENGVCVRFSDPDAAASIDADPAAPDADPAAPDADLAAPDATPNDAAPPGDGPGDLCGNGVCGPGETAAGCAADCGTTCTQCGGGECAEMCTNMCTATCASTCGECSYDCTNVNACDVTCDGPCSINCDNTNFCDEVVCNSNDCLIDCFFTNACGFKTCTSGAMNCGGGILVCGRPCP
jgi:hypothetical protein